MRIILFIIGLFLYTLSFAAEKAIVLSIDGLITPATQNYIERGIDYAHKQKAALIIIDLNTTGGLDSAMRGINEAIITSPVPIVTYISPSARATNSGTFIVYASHLAAMSTNSNIGAAAPIDTTKTSLSANEQKKLEDAAAYMRSIARLRGRNADWADLSVRKSVSISAQEAKKLKVIDEVADSYPQLLEKLDGHNVLVLGIPEVIKTKNLSVENFTPDWRYQFLSFLTNPTITYLLLLIAIYGLFFEFTNPGLILPGAIGCIALLLTLYALQLMVINYLGLLLLILGIICMIAEVYLSSLGILGIIGLVIFIAGSVLIFDFSTTNYKLNLILISGMGILSMAFFFILINLAIKSHKKAIITGQEGLIGSIGIVLSVMNQQIVVRVLGEIWEARSTEQLQAEQQVKVTAVHGLTLIVEPLTTTKKIRSK